MTERRAVTPLRVLLGWGVHTFTAGGAVLGLLAIHAIAQEAYREALFWMALTIGIDSLDGTLARKVGVKEAVPYLDGALLDNLVDFFTYVIVPAYGLYESAVFPAGWRLVGATAIILASSYQFTQREAKTADHFFLGFPSYWNIVFFYCLAGGWPPWVNLVLVGCLAVLVFVPVKYLYPSRTRVLRWLTLGLTFVWAVMAAVILYRYPEPSPFLLYASLTYVGYYFGTSLFLTAYGRPSRQDETAR